MLLHIEKPEKVTDFYLANITTAQNKRLKIILSDCNWVQINGNIVRLWVPPNSETAEAIKEVDEEAYSQTVKNNSKWFPNTLSVEKINEFFRKSIHPQYSTFSVLLSQWKPAIIYKDQEVHEKIDPNWNFKDYFIRIELEAEGICFFKHRFGVRWIIRKLWLRKIESDGDLYGDIDREELQNSCKEEAHEFYKYVDQNIQSLHEKIKELEAFKEKMQERIDNLSNLEDIKWQNEMEELSKAMHKYSIGAWNHEHIQNFICHRI